jgi:hypothetical protein
MTTGTARITLEIRPKILQEFQPVEKTVHVGRVLADLELTQPDKAGYGTTCILCQQGIEPRPYVIAQPPGDPGIDPPFRRDQRIRAQPLDDRDPGQDSLGCPALLHKAPCQIIVRSRRFGRIFQPNLQVPRSSAREHLVTVDFPQRSKMLATGFFTGRIVRQIIRTQPELRSQETCHGLGNDLTWRQ